MILAEAEGRHPDGPDDSFLEIGPATDMIVNLTRPGVHEEPVDGEVAALGIFRGRREDDSGRVPTIGVGRVGAKRRHLDLTASPGSDDGDHPERGADGERPRATEHRSDVVRAGRGGNVVVGRRPAKEFVPDTSPSPQRFKACGAQPIDDAPRKRSGLDGIGRNSCHGTSQVDTIPGRS